ncbi:MAG: UPF0182 family protein [Deltaproteobacteria bacterium]|nr:UPF0182 family protein [Deltaproteobacteria bacterium]
MNIKRLLILLGIIAVIILWAIISVYPNWLWFCNLNFSPVFWTMVLGKFGLATVIWLFMIIILFANLYTAQRFYPSNEDRTAYIGEMPVSGRTLDTFLIAVILVVSLLIASRGSAQWDMVLSYFRQQPFDGNDPIFNKNIGFYVFSLPFYLFIREELMVLFLFAGLVTIVWYFKDGGLQIIGEFAETQDKPLSFPKFKISKQIGSHLLILCGIIVLLIAWGYHLKIYGILYSTHGPAFGASFTDIIIRKPVFRILTILSILFGLFILYNAFKINIRHLTISGIIWVAAIIILPNGLPILFQKLIVKPNELARESTYIDYNIKYTRNAYNLNNIKEVDFEVSNTLGTKDIENNDTTIQNIRVWDEQPITKTYRQIQAIRLYYDFNNIDVDRYVINNQYRQVMLSARELIVNQLPPQAKTWVNRHLIYTHGYGVAMSPVNEITTEGLPNLIIKDLPPVATDKCLEINHPEIYFGERTDDYVLIRTNTKEFDYAKGDLNEYTYYEGKGGVPIDSFLKRILFAIEFLDPQILFTTYLNPESRIMFNRRIDTRVIAIAPFLSYDKDPYIVVSGGKLFWIQDAYTTSNMYPYSKRSSSPFRNSGLNYIRNSVKVVIDAYNGDVSYYLIDEEDPVIKTYSRIFPDLFRPFDEMPDDLKKHVRYPRDLFDIQVNAYAAYHMQNAQVFYNQEDLWEIPDEMYGDNRLKMKPYYIIIKLPESDKEEFLFMLPFTPSNKDNMIGWLAARSDLPNYGKLLVYKLPKEKLVYGPMQIEARVNQQTEISREFSLWDQRGSRVIRGNLMAIPINDSFLYVEPIYLEAKQEVQETAPVSTRQPGGGLFGRKQPGTETPKPTGKAIPRTAALPELKRVIVALGNRVAMEETLESAINKVLEIETVLKKEEPPLQPEYKKSGVVSDLGMTALDHYNRAKDFLRAGDWAGYGEELEKLENILIELSEKNQDGN